jgi:hypothetical protein
MRKLVAILQAHGNQAELRLMGDFVRQSFEHDRITEVAGSALGLHNRHDTKFARDRNAESPQQSFGIVFVDGAPGRPCRQ